MEFFEQDVRIGMKWYKCFVRGENFPGELFDEDRLFGFYVTQFVKANDVQSAETVCLEALRSKPLLVLPQQIASRAQARVYFEEITEWPADQVPEVQPGFAFYPMDGSDDG